MKIIFSLLLIIFFVFNTAKADQKTSYQNLSPELKGVISGGGATSIGAIVFGLSIAGVTAIAPLTIIGSTVGYVTIKANKKYKNFKSKKKKK